MLNSRLKKSTDRTLGVADSTRLWLTSIISVGGFDSPLSNMKKYTKEEIRNAINKSYERNSFNVNYFWKHLTGEYE